jgi:hypothetical protein
MSFVFEWEIHIRDHSELKLIIEYNTTAYVRIDKKKIIFFDLLSCEIID